MHYRHHTTPLLTALATLLLLAGCQSTPGKKALFSPQEPVHVVLIVQRGSGLVQEVDTSLHIKPTMDITADAKGILQGDRWYTADEYVEHYLGDASERLDFQNRFFRKAEEVLGEIEGLSVAGVEYFEKGAYKAHDKEKARKLRYPRLEVRILHQVLQSGRGFKLHLSARILERRPRLKPTLTRWSGEYVYYSDTVGSREILFPENIRLWAKDGGTAYISAMEEALDGVLDLMRRDLTDPGFSRVSADAESRYFTIDILATVHHINVSGVPIAQDDERIVLRSPLGILHSIPFSLTYKAEFPDFDLDEEEEDQEGSKK